ncbi:MAG: FadR/GntR family transcriptional regulator [Paraglaciecola sp.]
MSAQLATELGRQIVSGQLEPDRIIDGDTALAVKFNVCRTVAKEAVQILARKGLLEVRRKKGTRVRPFKDWLLLDDDVLAWLASAEPNYQLVKKLLEFRLSIEPKAAKLAAQNATSVDIEKIESICAQMMSTASSVQTKLKFEALFHNEILKASKNELLVGMDGLAFSSILICSQTTNHLTELNSNVFQTYKALTNAIVNRDHQSAEKLCEEVLMSKLNQIQTPMQDEELVFNA